MKRKNEEAAEEREGERRQRGREGGEKAESCKSSGEAHYLTAGPRPVVENATQAFHSLPYLVPELTNLAAHLCIILIHAETHL